MNIIKLLEQYGIDPSCVDCKNGYIEIETHVLNMNLFNEHYPEIKPKLSVFSNENKISLMVEEDEYVYDELYYQLKDIEEAINKQVYKLLLEEQEDLFLEKELKDRIPSHLTQESSLSSVKTWKVPIYIGNSMPDNKNIGDLDDVGYVMVGLNTGSIIPIARSDEHNRGYDLLEYYLSKSLIPDDKYIPFYIYLTDYVSPRDLDVLKAMKIWRKLNGPNLILQKATRSSNCSGSFQITMDDYIACNGEIEINKGELLPIGREFISKLKELSLTCQEIHINPNKIKNGISKSKSLIRFLETKIYIFSNSKLNVIAEKLKEVQNIQELEELIFGFDGVKNQIHNEIRKELDTSRRSFNQTMSSIFGDLELANHELGNI